MFCYSCGDDDDAQVVDPTVAFLTESVPQFRGKLDEFLIDYKFSLDYQMSSTSFNSNGSGEDPLRSLRFVLNQEFGDNQFILRSPNYDSSTVDGYDSLFALGSKSIGETTDSYRVQFTRSNKTYFLCAEDVGLELEVLKVEETEDTSGASLKVWYRLGTVPLNLCDTNDDEVLSNAYILAQFRSFRFGE